MPFVQGLGIGLATALLLGPVFFTLLRAAMEHGFKGGALVAMGIIISDVVALLICASGARVLFGAPLNGQVLALLGGILLFVLGLFYLLKTPRTGPSQVVLRKRDALGLFTSGFLVNFVNPFVFAVWTGLVLHATNAYAAAHDRTWFFVAVLVGILASDLLKAWFAPRLARLLSIKVMTWVHRGIAVLLVVSSARLFWLASLG
ncbi:MAG: LysE family transporter [Flavobacteriales bacterium]|nr:MAG: LysE family transporter [Flavobacteriales bacterium]